MDWNDFVISESSSRDTIDVKRVYIDMADDLVAGILLSQIIYWYLPDQNGKSKLRVNHEGYYWIAKCRADWWDECRITEKQYDRAIGVLVEKGLVVTDTTLFAGKPSKVVRLDSDKFMASYQAILATKNRGEKRSSPKVNNEIDQRSRTITENTPESTTEMDSAKIAPPPLKEEINREQEQRAIEEFNAMPSASANMPAGKLTAEGCDPYLERKEYQRELVPRMANVFRHTAPSPADRGACGKLHDQNIPLKRAQQYLIYAENGGGESYRTKLTSEGKHLNAYNVVQDICEWKANGYPALGHDEGAKEVERATLLARM